jgi:hypothetical protein
MVAIGGRAGVTRLAPGPGFARPRSIVQGNELPADSGWWGSTYHGEEDLPGPSPSSPGYVIGGTAGAGNDGFWGPDPRQPEIISPVFLPGQDPAGMDAGTENHPGAWRGGLQGFNDKLRVVDRHAFWNTGNQRTGTTFAAASANPNSYNDPLQEPPQARLRTVNRSVTYQKGTDATRNQDDLSRGYTWVGEQGSGYQPVYGGVPGLYQPYGTRGGVPYPIVDPSAGQGGRELVWAGPPHGLHSLTFPDQADTLLRYQVLPQMRPVRVDRPSNSPQAGQAYSQTVQHQGMARVPKPGGITTQKPVHHQGRGWAGARAMAATAPRRRV